MSLLIVGVVVLVRPLQKNLGYGSVASNRIGMKFGRIVLQLNAHGLAELDF